MVAPSIRGLIARPRFDPLSPRTLDARLWVLEAAAGCGKTCLAALWFAQLEEQGAGAVWITLRPDVETAAQLAAYIAAALGPAAPAPPIETALEFDRLLSSLADHLASRGAVTLFLDGTDQLGATASDLLSDLIVEAPAATRFVLTSRRAPGFARAGLRTRKALVELNAESLRLSRKEASALLPSLEPAEAARLNDQVEGWAAGLALLGQDPDPATAGIDDYLEEEVLASVPPALREWLGAVSIADRFCEDLCEAVVDGSDGRAFAAIRDRGLPVRAAKGAPLWLQLHPCLVDYLRRRLSAQDERRLRDLHLRASRWFAAHQDTLSAIRHAAESGDVQWLAALLEAECETLALDGRIDLVDHHSQHIPASILLLHPRLTAALAWLKTRSLRLDESRRLLAAAQERVALLASRGELSAARHHELALHCLHQELMCAVAEGSIGRIDSLSRQLLAEPEGRKPFMLYSALTQNLAVRRETFDLAGVESLVADAQAALQRGGYRTASVTIASAAGSALFACGKAGRAITLLNEGIEQSGSDGLGSIAALPLSEILYEQDKLEEAQALIERYLPFARGFGFLDHLAPGHIVRARLARLANGPAASLDLLEESLGLARRSGLKRLALTLAVEMVRCQVELGRRQQAIDLATEFGFAGEAGSFRPARAGTGAGEMRAIGWFHLHGLAEHPDALRLASDWARFGSVRGAPSTSVRWQLNLARLHAQGYEMERATRSVRIALKEAEPMNLVRPFLEQPPAIHAIVERIAGTAAPTFQMVDDFAIRISGRLSGDAGGGGPAAGGAPIGGIFGQREIEILSLAAQGASNREIGMRLGLTEGTVKWYLQQIYDKTGVRRRSQAVLMARTAGLIG